MSVGHCEEKACCSICCNDLEEGGAEVCTLECSHKFHASCLIPWLRRGGLSCPNCRTDLTLSEQEDNYGYMNIRARASYLRNVVSKRRNAPCELKNLVTTLRKAEVAERDKRKLFSAFKRGHREILKQYRLKRDCKWRARRQVCETWHALGLYGTEDGLMSESFFSIRCRARYLRTRVARRRSAPKNLKTLIAKLRRLEEEKRTKYKEFVEWKRDHKEILRKYNLLQSQMFRCETKIRDARRVLGLYDRGDLSLPRLLSRR